MEGDKAFSFYRSYLWLLGVWPLEEKSPCQTFRYVVAASAMASLLLHTLTEMYVSDESFSDMAELALFCSSAFLALTKHTFLNLHRDKLAESLRSYMNDWAHTMDEGFLKIMRSQVKLCKYHFLVYYSVGYIGTTLFFLRTILLNVLEKREAEPEDFEYTLVCPMSFLSKETVAKYYGLIMFIQYIQSMYTCTSGAGSDCFFLGVVFHLCGQLKVLKSKWYRLGIEKKGFSVNGGSQRKKVIGLIDRHRELVDVGERLEMSFNGIVLIQLVTSIILICMSGFGLLMALKENDYVTALVSTNCISFMITESFIYGYSSDYLIAESEEIVQAAYSIGWYDADPHTKRDIGFVIMRAQIPLCITAGKFFAVTRNTIVQLLKTTASFLSVMRITLEISD